MTKQAGSRLALFSAIASVPAVAGVVFWLLNAAFVSAAEFAPVERDVRALQADVKDIRRGVDLNSCVIVAKDAADAQRCVREYNAK